MRAEIGEEIVALLPRLRRMALALCRSVDEADELVQVACEKALGASDQFVAGTRVDSWLFRILRNAWLDGLRRRRTRGTEVEIDDTLGLADTRNPYEGEERLYLAQVWAHVQALPPDQREVLVLVCVEELSYREAAEILDVPVGTVMSRLARARRKIADATGASAAEKGALQ